MQPSLRPATAEDALGVAEVLAASRRVFLPFAPSAHTPEENRHWVERQLLPQGGVHLAERSGQVVAVLATSADHDASWIEQLYVLPGHEGQGIGTRLLLHAHAVLTPPIRLYTFQENVRARRFYERHGYIAIQFSDGALNEEHCPDVLYERSALAPQARRGH
jgi:ribosomal protein S18 acetylase RimI-like enzyme